MQVTKENLEYAAEAIYTSPKYNKFRYFMTRELRDSLGVDIKEGK
jgi:hypothetical protein